MDVQELMRAVQRQFGDESGAVIQSEDIFRWINDGQFQIARRTGDSVTSTSIALAVGDYQKPLPNDFFKIQNAELDGCRLQVITFAQMGTLYPTLDSVSAQQGTSKYAAVNTPAPGVTRLTLAPRTGVAGTLVVSYNLRPPIINSTDDALSIPEEFHSTLIVYCLAKAKQMDGDDSAAAEYLAEFKGEVHEDSHDARHQDEETYPFIRTSPGDYC